MDPAVGWSFRRSVFRSYLEELGRTDLLAVMRSGASERLLALLERPGDAPEWIDSAPFEEIAAVIRRERGDEGLRELGYHVMKTGFTKVLEPLIHLSLAALGGSPASLFARLPQMLSIVARGLEMSWAPRGAAAGTIQIRCGQPVEPTHWTTWEGTFRHGLELAGATGTVGEARPAADGRSCEIEVSWQPR